MRTLIFSLSILLTVFCTALLAPSAQAAENYSDLMNKAGMQRMLSQRIAKAYLYKGNSISTQEVTHQLKIALTRFEYNHAALQKVKDDGMQELLGIVQGHFATYKELVAKPYSQEHAAAVLELSETLLTACQNAVQKLEELSGAKIDTIINTSGRQRMLSQRIAKYYIAYQVGFQDEQIAQQLEAAATEFTSALKLLREEKRNTGEIHALLGKMEKSWGIISSYVLQVRSKGNPAIVLNTTDDITKLADEATALYVAVAAAAEKKGGK